MGAHGIAQLAFGPWVLGPGIDALRPLLELVIAAPENHIHALHLLDNRLQKHPQDITRLEGLALAVVAKPSSLLADSMSQYHWDKLARMLVPRHARAIARTIFAAQAKRDGESFFLEHSLAASTLNACIATSAADVWEELAPMLVDDYASEVFAIGLPSHILEQMPRQAVLDWVNVEPEVRAVRIARMTAGTFADGSLAAALLDQWGHVERVRQRFFSAFVSGGSTGEASAHWEALAVQVDSVAAQSKSKGVRHWARQAARDLRRMAEQERKQEVEERVRGYR